MELGVLVEAEVRRLERAVPREHFVQDRPHAPEVGVDPVALLPENLGRDVPGCAARPFVRDLVDVPRVPVILHVGDLAGQP